MKDPSKSTNLGYAKAWLQQAQAELSDGVKPNPKTRPTRPTPKPTQRSIWLVGLGLMTLLVMFGVILLLLPSTLQSNDAVAALDISGLVTPHPFSSEPAQPTPTLPPLDIVGRQLAQTPLLEATPLNQPLATNSVINLRGVEITQGIQVFQEPENPRCLPDPTQPDFLFCNNSMPMVAGRHTMVRVYLGCQANCPLTQTTVRLRIFKAGQEQAVFTHPLLAETVQRVNTLALYDLRLALENSVNFEFLPPPAWMSGQITFEVEALTSSEVKASIIRLTKDFVLRKPLRIAYLPIEYQGLRPPDPLEVDYWLLRLYPVSEVEYYRLPMPDIVWQGNVNKSEVLRKLLYTYWFYAQYNPTTSRPDQLFGWLPKEFYNGGASDPFWCPTCAGPHSSRVAFGGLRPEQDIGGPRILAHEIAHNLGAQHAWSPTNKEDVGCFRTEGVDIQVDPTWPYAQTPHIQEVGLDLYSNPPLIHPPSIYDMMAYCTQPWISPHTYRKLFDSPFLNPAAPPSVSIPDFKAQLEANQDGTLLVSGVIYPDGTVSRPEIIKLSGAAFDSASGFNPPLEFAPPPGYDYCLEVQADNDNLLAQHCFDVGFIDLESGLPTEASPYFFTLPNINAAKVEKVTISRNQEVVIIITPSNSPPEVTLTFPNGGEVLKGRQNITWEAYDADGDSLTYDLLYSPNAGQSWLPLAVRLTEPNYTFYTHHLLPSDRALIRVIATDGFNTSIDQSDGTFSLQAPPENSISLIGPSEVKPGPAFEIDVVAHRVTEPGLFGVQFRVTFDPALAQVNAIRANSALDLVVDDTIDNNEGLISFVASRKGRVDNLQGDIILATLLFSTTQNEGQLHLDLHNVVAGARNGIYTPISEVEGLSLAIIE